MVDLPFLLVANPQRSEHALFATDLKLYEKV